MEIEKITITRINLSGYDFPEFDILVIPSEHDGKPVSDCYLLKRNSASPFYMFGVFESEEEAAEMAYNSVPDYLPLYVADLLKEDDE